ncbi:MAG: U32 family peptidase [Ignavibacteriales bacterium]|nr:U32 family peptidase [Ignavibacteriales bacterium]
MVELLCPAREVETGIAAINHGADAVYIGAPKFGARADAGNDVRDIERLIAYAHRFRARVYVTLNTILYDNELDEARALAVRMHDAGADALIIQDMGLLEMDLPPIPLFASTQTHNFDIERIQFLEQVGLQRVILARELTLKQIAEIRARTSIELEFFVHGALCVSFSGQCYFSQAVKDRSANRGECAQMCRLPYSLIDAQGNVLASHRHLLSVKDLNLADHLSDLLNAGITSFKIEGRLKEISYVKNITAFYRSKLDAILEERPEFRRSSSGSTYFFFAPDPDKTFNRGYTDYFVKGRRQDIASLRTPKSLGKLLGTVTSVSTDTFEVKTGEVLNNGDGICFFDANDDLCGVNVNNVAGTQITPNDIAGIQSGTILYRNFDHDFVKLLKGESSSRKIAVDLTLSETADGFSLRVRDRDGMEVGVSIVHAKEPAKKPEAMRETILSQLSKAGDTIFVISDITVDLPSMYFIPVAVLNRLRRDCLALLEDERGARYTPQRRKIIPNDVPCPLPRLDYSFNVVNNLARRFYQRHGVESIEDGFELQNDHSGQVLMTMRHCLKFQAGLCRGERGGDEILYLSDGRTRFRLEVDCDRCVMKIIAP